MCRYVTAGHEGSLLIVSQPAGGVALLVCISFGFSMASAGWLLSGPATAVSSGRRLVAKAHQLPQ
jgi:hypothetical protein